VAATLEKSVPLQKSVGKTKGNLVTQSQVFANWISKNSLHEKKAQFTESLLVLYGSQSGKSKDLAERLSKLGQLMELFVSCQCISSYSFDRLHTMKMVVIVTSTYGHGEPPENAVPLFNWLNESHPPDHLHNTKYSVLKVGSSVYSEPFAFGTFVDNGLKKLGATQLTPAGRIDEIKYTDDEDFNQFAFNLFSSVDAPKDMLLRTKSLGFFNESVVKSKYKLVMVPEIKSAPQRVDNGSFSVEVLQNVKLTQDPQNEIYKMEVKNSANLKFEVGDELVVWHQNSDSEVKSLISRLGFPAHSMFHLEIDSESDETLPNWAITATNLSHLLTHHLDLHTVSPSLLKFFALHAQDQRDCDKLTDLAGASNARFALQNLTILDVLELHPSVQLAIDQLIVFLGLLKDLRPRYYSISSSPNHSKGIIRITYKIVRYVNHMNKRREGACSSFLASRKVKDLIYVKIQSSTFRIPDEPATPIIMIGAGTGVSPFIGFTEERRYQKELGPIGKTTFLYGCSNKAAMIEPDFWEKGLMDGVLDSVLTAFSKESAERVYVQDQIASNFDKLWALIEAGACIYSCGDVKVGTAVKDAIINGIAKKNNWTVGQAAEYVKKMVVSKRYHRSEWGLQENPQKTIKSARFRLWAKSVLAMVRWMKIIKTKTIQ
jgi:sulfite reductase alpha subunit-like flavoprotein